MLVQVSNLNYKIKVQVINLNQQDGGEGAIQVRLKYGAGVGPS